jgi:hypothetical protein
MSFSKQYKERVEAVVTILPLLKATPEFALKGGTAINLFYQDFPRLSVDIDLCYLPIKERGQSIEAIASGLKTLKTLIENRLKWSVQQSTSSTESIDKLIVQSPLGIVKIEPNYIIRGSVFEPVNKSLSEKTAATLEAHAEVKCLSLEDIYAGKFCAALDRQHPRDLFDVHIFLKENAFSPRLIKAFIVYLIQSNRPIHELLNPNHLDINHTYENEFRGMTDFNVNLEDLTKIQQTLHKTLISKFSNQDKEFLISYKQGKPDWDKLQIGDHSNLPGVQWKLQNIQRMKADKHQTMLAELHKVIELR